MKFLWGKTKYTNYKVKFIILHLCLLAHILGDVLIHLNLWFRIYTPLLFKGYFTVSCLLLINSMLSNVLFVRQIVIEESSVFVVVSKYFLKYCHVFIVIGTRNQTALKTAINTSKGWNILRETFEIGVKYGYSLLPLKEISHVLTTSNAGIRVKFFCISMCIWFL